MLTYAALCFEIEPPLCWAGERVSQTEWEEAHAALRSICNLLRLHRPPNYVEYDPARLLEVALEGAGRYTISMEGLQGKSLIGDPDQITAMVRILLEAAVLEFDASLAFSLVASPNGTASLLICMDGPGRIPELLRLEGAIELPFPALADAWTAATRGGRIDRVSSGLDLRLEGQRVLPKTESGFDPLFQIVSRAEEHLQLIEAGTCGGSAPAHAKEAGDCIAQAIAILNKNNVAPCATDMANLLRDSVRANGIYLDNASILLDIECAPDLPPVEVCRGGLLRFFANAFKHTRVVLERGGRLSILVEYERVARAVSILFAGEGDISARTDTPMIASMRRCVVEQHEGSFEYDADPDGFTMTARFPDRVGRRLEVWIRGFDAFSPVSVQMLRLLKSGAPTPPEDFILQGVLEDELERMLLPYLGVAPATHLASELLPGSRMLAGSSINRQSKVLSQISRGRAKKEICRPPYAGELIWMYAKDERHRAAIGMQTVSEDTLREISQALLLSPIDHVLCLRMLAEILSRREDRSGSPKL